MRCWASATSALCRGMGNAPGESAPSHSSVHELRSMRAGLPVSERDRMVSRDVAARNFCFTAGWVSASSVVSQTEPHHTPSAPRARAAAICRPLPMPPAADDRGGSHGVDDLGHEHHGGDLTGVAAGLGPLGHDDVDTRRVVALGVGQGARQGGDRPPRPRGPA